MRNREFVFTPKIEYKLVAERLVVSSVEPSEANQNSLTFPVWCPRGESNTHQRLRSPQFYPLNYEGLYTTFEAAAFLFLPHGHRRLYYPASSSTTLFLVERPE